MTEQTKARACRALCWNNELHEQHPVFDCVWIVANHICFQDYVANAWWKELDKEYPIEVIKYHEARKYLFQIDSEKLEKLIGL